ncbi:MAG: M28 family metallopeptidase [Paraclostridium sp.]
MFKFKIILIFLSVVFLIGGCSNKDIEAINNDKRLNLKVEDNLILQNINNISLNIRNFGSQGECRASKYLKEKLKEYGYVTQSQPFNVYKQEFLQFNSKKQYFKLNPSESESIGESKNIIGRQSNFDKNKKTIYLTAHYDTTKDTIGVIDNATGVGALLEMARVLKDYELPFNIEIIFFGAEEYGMYGSKFFVSKLSDKEKSKTIGAINLDMIGEKGAGEITVYTSSKYNNQMSIMMKSHFKDKFKYLNTINSDQYSFYMGGIPAVTFSNENAKVFNGDNQFEFVDIEQIKYTCNSIIGFLVSFNNSTYSDTLIKSNKLDLENSLSGKLQKFKLVSVKENLVEGGFSSEITYTYLDEKGIRYELKEKDGRFTSFDEYKDITILDRENEEMYKIIKNEHSSNQYKLIYRWGNCDGVLISDGSLKDSLKFLDYYYKAYYKKTFGEIPPKSIE